MSELEIAQDLLRFHSVTPLDCGAIEYVANFLNEIGFETSVIEFGDEEERILNLYARYGKESPNFCFAGHTDVVPVGDQLAWSSPPFSAEIDEEGFLIGRGAVDMKGALASFMQAAKEFIENNKFKGSVSFLITGDEEANAKHGTVKVLEWLKNKGEKIDFCIVGEPTNPSKLGEMIKVGRRGSLTLSLSVTGQQGHVAYPHLADNPITKLIHILHDIKGIKLDEGNEFFDPSNLEIVSLNVNNNASNVIPAHADSLINIRFNNMHTSGEIFKIIDEACKRYADNYQLKIKSASDAFLTKLNKTAEILREVVKEETGINPEFSTTGGTSDARFIKDYADVLEFGLINQTAHKIDEKIHIRELAVLKKIYYKLLCRYFSVG